MEAFEEEAAELRRRLQHFEQNDNDRRIKAEMAEKDN